MRLFEHLSAEQEAAFRRWARDNYEIYSPIDGVWHPVVQDECTKMNAETGYSPDGFAPPGPSSAKRIADRIDGYDRDDLGESPDY